MKFILGKKIKMMQVFENNGRAVAGTLVSAPPVTVIKVKTAPDSRYEAVQIGFGAKSLAKMTKAAQGELKPVSNLGAKEGFELFKEFRCPKSVKEDLGEVKVGDKIDVSAFAPGDVVRVSAISKGKGFQGVVKRHGFEGGRRSHGQKHSEREPGSIGATGPQRVFPGTRMGGRMGSDRVTIKGLKVVRIDRAAREILVSGAIPGRRGTVVEIVSK